MNPIAEWAQEALTIFEEESILARRVHRTCTEYSTQRDDKIVLDAAHKIVLDTEVWVSFIVKDSDRPLSFVDLKRKFINPSVRCMCRGIDNLIIKHIYADRCVNAPRLSKISRINAREIVTQTSEILNSYSLNNRSLVLDPRCEAELLRGGQWVYAEQLNLAPVMFPFDEDILPEKTCLAWYRDAVALGTGPMASPEHTIQSCITSHNEVALRVSMNYDVPSAGVKITFGMLAGVLVLEPKSIVVLDG